MRGILSIVLAAAIALFGYYFYLKESVPEKGMVATQTISTTGVQMDLMSIAQAERMYYVQNNTYATLDQLSSSSTMNINRDGRDGYSYTVETTDDGFTATARHPDVPAAAAAGAVPPHFPAYAVDQNMQVHSLD